VNVWLPALRKFPVSSLCSCLSHVVGDRRLQIVLGGMLMLDNTTDAVWA